MHINRAIVAYRKPNYFRHSLMSSRIATCERRLMIISYFTSNDDRLEIDETTSNKRMGDLRDKDKNI